MRIVLINPTKKAPFSHLNCHLGLKEALERNNEVKLTTCEIDQAFNIETDYYFVIDYKDYKESFQRLRDKAKLCVWLLEEPYEIDKTLGLYKDVDLLFTMDKSGVEIRKKLFCNNAFLFPLGVNTKIFVDKYHPAYKTDLLICGVGFPNRLWIVEKLIDFFLERKYNVKIIGHWWDRLKDKRLDKSIVGKIINEMELSYYYSNTKIALEINRAFHNKNEKRVFPLSPGRAFNSCACKAFTLTDERRTLKEYFDINEDLVVYKSLDDLKNKIDYYITHDKERSEIAERGYTKARIYHSYDKRVKQLLEVLNAHLS